MRNMPEVFYGLHMVEGTAEYQEPGKDPYRIYISGDTIKNMNPSFKGKPVFVGHVDVIEMEDLQEKADGWVVRSFFNAVDGKNWVEFLAISDAAKEAIKNKGWKLSNAYIPKQFNQGGENHGVSYSREVIDGEYEHLAIVEDPRYEESIILTPEQFKQYNEDKTQELTRLANSKEKEKKMGLKFWERKKVENTKDVDLDSLMVELPLSKSEIEVGKLVNAFDKALSEKVINMHGYANGDHAVKVGDEEMSVNQLVKKFNKMCNDEKSRLEAEEEEKKNGQDEEATIREAEHDVGDRGGDHLLDNDDPAEDDLEDEKDNESDGDEDDAKKKKKNQADLKAADARKKAEALKNANQRRTDNSVEMARVDLGQDKIERGRSRYGS
jgi:hypothetical protein